MGLAIRNILVTGSDGFVGKNFTARLNELADFKVFTFDKKDSLSDLDKYVQNADIIFHLAGINRPETDDEFVRGNAGFTEHIISLALKSNKTLPVVFSSSIQAEINNPYGISKKKAEDVLINYSKKTGSKIFIFRFPNLFGKWCMPNYNSVVATYCYNVSHGLEIHISNRENKLTLAYIDDVITEFIKILKFDSFDETGKYFYEVDKVYNITLGEVADKISSFYSVKNSICIPDFKDDFTRKLYSTFLSYFEKETFSYPLQVHCDERGSLFEVLKSSNIGQIFISTTKPGIERGNHYHHTKIEKFIVIKGNGIVKLRNILGNEIIEYRVSGDSPVSIDIPPGYTHSIINTGNTEMITLFWANEIFDPEIADTYFYKVVI